MIPISLHVDPEMIPISLHVTPEMIPNLILEMQWYTRTMDRAKYTTLIKALL